MTKARPSGLPKASEKLLDSLEESATHALEVLTQLGVDDAEVSVSTGDRLEVSVRKGETDLIKEAKSSGMGVRVIRDGRVATSATTDLQRDSVEAFLARAVEMAELSEEDPMAAPPDPGELARRWKALELYDPRTPRVSTARALKLALAGEKAAFRADKRITSSEGATFARSSGHSVLGTTGGFLGRNAGTSSYLVVHVIADDEGGKKRNGYEWTSARFFEDLESAAAVGKEAARRAVASLGASKMPTGKYPVVFDRDAAGAIVGLVASCVLGGAVYRDQSYLRRKLGKMIASKKVNIVDDPHLPRGPGSRPYDGEGRATHKNVVVKAGQLESFLLDTYSARKLKLSPTASGGGGGGIPHSTTSNFYMKAGRAKPESLLKGIEQGLFVTSMMGFGFDSVTGDFSRGAQGFLIENGQLGRPIGEITIARNLDGLLKGIDMVANDLRHKSSVAAPSFRVDEMTISGS
jgi:PmbA protein